MADLTNSYRGAIFVTPEHPWPSTSGARVRAAGIAAALAEIGPLKVLALDSSETSDSWLDAVHRHRDRRQAPAKRARDIAAGLIKGRHVVLERAEAAGLPNALGVLLRSQPSVVVLGRPLWGRFITEARNAGATVIAEADESQAKVSRSLLRSAAPATKRGRAVLDLLSAARMEGAELRRADQIWVSSDREVAAVRQDVGGVEIVVIPNATEVPAEPPGSPAAAEAVGFVGYYAHPPNEAAALELISSIMPAVRLAGGPDRLLLIGREPTDRMRRAADADGGVTITGAVSEPSSALREAGVLVMPIRSGGGTRIKAVEAAVAGVPIVSTAFGVEGLGFRPNVHFLLAESPAEFGAAVEALRDPDARSRLVAAAFRQVKAFNSREAQAAAVRRAVAQAVSATSSAATSETTAFGR